MSRSSLIKPNSICMKRMRFVFLSVFICVFYIVLFKFTRSPSKEMHSRRSLQHILESICLLMYVFFRFILPIVIFFYFVVKFIIFCIRLLMSYVTLFKRIHMGSAITVVYQQKDSAQCSTDPS